jgi:hypothetical protein
LRRARRLVLIGLGLAFAACVQNPPPGPEALEAAAEKGAIAADPLFWSVEPEGGAAIYLLGSVHIGPREGWRMPERVRAAFRRSETLAVEVDPFAISPAEMMFATKRHTMAPDGQSLDDLVPEDLMRDIEAYAAKHEVPMRNLRPMRPWSAALALGQATAGESGFTPFEAVDLIFLTRRGKRDVISLETIDDQLSIMSAMPREIEIEMLQEAISEHPGEGPSLLLLLVDAWRRGDEAAIAELHRASFGNSVAGAALAEELLIVRNQRMSARLATFARDPMRAGQSVFCVVGVGHLVGEDSVVSQLADEGLVIEQLGPPSSRRTARAASHLRSGV